MYKTKGAFIKFKKLGSQLPNACTWVRPANHGAANPVYLEYDLNACFTTFLIHPRSKIMLVFVHGQGNFGLASSNFRQFFVRPGAQKPL